jgi:hypothetical protein
MLSLMLRSISNLALSSLNVPISFLDKREVTPRF